MIRFVKRVVEGTLFLGMFCLFFVVSADAQSGGVSKYGDVLLFSSDSLDKTGNKIRVLCRINTDGSGWTNITPDIPKSQVRRSSVSSRGRKIAYFQHIRTHVCDWDGSNDVDVTPVPREHFLPAWSPDGKEIAFTTDRNNNAEIYVMNADGSNARNVSWSPMSSDMSPAWSPDGKTIAFISNRNGKKFELFTMDVNGFNRRLVASLDGDIREPAWSVNDKIAFALEKNGVSNIFVINPDGTRLKQLTKDDYWNGQPAWNADGTRLAFVSTKSGNANIWVMDSNGGGRRNVTRSNTKDSFFPCWVPKQISDTPLVVTKANVSGKKLQRPRMLFKKEDIPGIRRRLETPPYNETWRTFLKRCDVICDTSSAKFKSIDKSIEAIKDGGAPNLYNNAPWIEAVYDLAFAYQITGDVKYGDQGKKLLMRAGRLYATYHAEMQYTYQISCAYDWLYALLGDDERKALTALLETTTQLYFDRIIQHNLALGPLSTGNSNIGVFLAGDIGPMALVLAGEPGFKSDWLAGSIRLTAMCMNNWIGDAGDCSEGFSYFAAPLRQIMPFLVSLKINGLAPFVFDSNLKKIAKWMAVSAANGVKETVNIGDCDSMRLWIPPGLLKLYPEDQLLKALWNRVPRGKKPPLSIAQLLWWRPARLKASVIPPLPKIAKFANQSYVVMRSGYSDDDPMMTLSNPIIPGHSHRESGAVLLYGYGTRFLVDPGQGVSVPQLHNNILINGRGRGKGTELPKSALKVVSENILGGIARADMKQAFAKKADGYLDYKIPGGWLPIERGARDLAMVYAEKDGIPPYFVIYDDVKMNRKSNKYSSLFLLDMDKKVEVGDHRFVVENAYDGPWFTPGNGGVKGTIDFEFTSKKQGKYKVWMYVREPAKFFGVELNGKHYPTGWAAPTTTREGCWQWKCLKNGKQLVELNLKSGVNHLKIGLCGISVFARIILTSSDVDFYGEGPAPKLPLDSLILTADQGKPRKDMILKSPESGKPKALFAMLNPAPVEINQTSRRFKTRFYGQQLVVLPQVIAERTDVNARFLLFVYPYREGMEQPRISASEKNGLICGKVEWKNATDWILSAPYGEKRASAKFETDADLAIVRTYPDGHKTRMLLPDGKHLSIRNKKTP